MREMEEGPSLGTEGVVRGTHSEHTHTLTEGDERERELRRDRQKWVKSTEDWKTMTFVIHEF